jgi:hypothetical protein
MYIGMHTQIFYVESTQGKILKMICLHSGPCVDKVDTNLQARALVLKPQEARSEAS